jgi:predicted DNA-binding transcriptional regulator YafY
VNRTDRLYALVEELRAASPRPRTSRGLAERFEVSVRTIERDLSALQQAGVPIWATPGPGGGYTLDPEHTLAPVNFTPTEALALALAASRAGSMPWAGSARTALQKLLAAMAADAAVEARELADRVALLQSGSHELAGLDPVLEDAVLHRRVLRIRYADAGYRVTERVVEPQGFVGNGERWYLRAWCRLRGEARSFRIDRLLVVTATDELAPERGLAVHDDGDIPRSTGLVVISGPPTS